MQVTDFATDHIERAAQIAKQNYEEERGFVPALPIIDAMPDMKPFIENGLGVDYETFNATAHGYWTKYFTTYTHSVVRRIDEHAASRL